MFYPRDVPFRFANKVSLGELLTCPLHPQIKMVLSQFDELGLEFVYVLLSQLFRFHHIADRRTIVVAKGSLDAASVNAARATSSGTPSIS